MNIFDCGNRFNFNDNLFRNQEVYLVSTINIYAFVADRHKLLSSDMKPLSR